MKVCRLFVAAAALLVVLAPSRAEVIAVKAGLLIDGTGAPPRKDPVVVVENGKIVSVGNEAPKGSTIIDLGDRTLLPGFIDCHVHLAGRVIGEGENWDDAAVRDLPQEQAIRGVRNAKATLEAGFTTVRNVGASDFSDIALRNMIREGVVPGPRIVAAAHAIGITGGHCDTNGYRPGVLERDPEHGVADGAADLVGVDGNPLEDVKALTAPSFVMHDGKVVGTVPKLLR